METLTIVLNPGKSFVCSERHLLHVQWQAELRPTPRSQLDLTTQYILSDDEGLERHTLKWKSLAEHNELGGRICLPRRNNSFFGRTGTPLGT